MLAYQIGGSEALFWLAVIVLVLAAIYLARRI
jgi:hypothetical protein